VAVEFTRSAHTNLQDMVKLADAKATALMGSAGVIVALFGSNLIDKFVAKSVSWWLLGLGAVTLLLLLSAALCAILVLVPRFPGPEQVTPVVGAPGLMWSLDRYYRAPSEYVQQLLTLTPHEVIGDLAHENLKITWILKRKWAWLGRAAKLLVVAFGAWAVTVVRAVLGG
jgi:hypothetical protein